MRSRQLRNSVLRASKVGPFFFSGGEGREGQAAESRSNLRLAGSATSKGLDRLHRLVHNWKYRACKHTKKRIISQFNRGKFPVKTINWGKTRGGSTPTLPMLAPA